MVTRVYERLDGIERLARDLSGSETIHVGIRPFGFHAGNLLSLVVYPELLFQEFARQGAEPRFRLLVSVNDWEQHMPSGIDPVRYPYNIKPADSIFKFTPGHTGGSIVDQWEPHIRDAFAPLRARYPEVAVELRRNTVLRDDERVVPLLRKTKEHARDIGEIFARLGRYEIIVDDTLTFAEAVCPDCRTARGASRFVDDVTVELQCERCGSTRMDHALAFDWWWHHKPLFVARWHLWQFDVALSGGDHFDDHDQLIRDEIRELFELEESDLRSLFAPLVVDHRGWKMSKSAHNEVAAQHDRLLAVAGRFRGAQLSIDEVVP